MMTIGIDPGLARCGYAVWPGTRSYTLTPEMVGYWRTDPGMGLDSKRIEALARAAGALFHVWGGHNLLLALETQHIRPDLPAGVGRSVLQVAQVAGAIRGVAETLGIPVVDVSPQRAKLALTGKGDATKEEMLTAVERQYGLRLARSAEHAADALGIAIAGETLRRMALQPPQVCWRL